MSEGEAQIRNSGQNKFQREWKEAGLPLPQISRAEIAAAKVQLRRGGAEGYREICRVISDPVAVIRERLISGTQTLQRILIIVTIFNILSLVVSPFLLFFLRWGWALGAFAGYFIGSKILAEINYEIGARLVALDLRLEETRKQPGYSSPTTR